jgi:RepB DNA-primase N-terminal domain
MSVWPCDATTGPGRWENCLALPAIFVDVDFKSTPEAEARKEIAALPLPPTLVVHSGGGLHVYYALREALDLTTDEPRARTLLRQLALALGGDRSAAEPARVLRVPGTFNRKPEYSSPRAVILEECEPNRRYNLHELEEWLPALLDDASATGRFHVATAPVGPGDRSTYVFRMARSLKTRGYREAGVLALCREENRASCVPPLDDAKVAEQVRSAFAQADRPGFEPRVDGIPDSTNDDPLASRVIAPPLPAFPLAGWRGLTTWKAATDGTTEAPDAIRFAAIIAPLAARIGRRVSLHYGVRLYPNLYVVGFGPTGSTRKTSAARAARAVLPASVRVVRGVGSGEALIEALQSSAGDDPVETLLEADELAVLLARAKWDASSLPALLTEAYDCPDTLEVRLRKGTLLSRQPFVCALGFTTAEWFWRSMPEVHVVGGLGNRFLYFTGTPGPPIAFPPRPDGRRVADFLAHLDGCDAHLAAQAPERLALALPDLSADVRALWAEFYAAWTSTERALPELLAAAVRRLPAYAWKLTLLYAYLERTLPTLTVAQLGAALEVIHYALASTRVLVDRRGAGTAQGRLEARVVKAIEARPLPAWKIHHRLSGDCSLEDLARALKALAGARVIEVVAKTPRGTEVWGLVGHGKREDA